jgi:hypothetical protein
MFLYLPQERYKVLVEKNRGQPKRSIKQIEHEHYKSADQENDLPFISHRVDDPLKREIEV